MQPTQLQYLKALGIDVWVDRNMPSLESAVENQSILNESAEQAASSKLRTLEKQVAKCTACVLHESRTQTVYGVGNANADWLIIGEAPGAEEDKQGEPFVGRAGLLLNDMLKAIDLSREEIYIANILKCRPPNNRDPRLEEAQACENFLKKQITLIKPKIILCVGRIAAQNLLKDETPIGKMRGQRYVYADTDTDTNIPVVVTYHPAYLLRSPKEKRKSWEDLKMAVKIFNGES